MECITNVICLAGIHLQQRHPRITRVLTEEILTHMFIGTCSTCQSKKDEAAHG